MTRPTLRRGDGLKSGRPELKESVKELQQLLGIESDGLFGVGTEDAVKSYQTRNGLDRDGVVGPATWKQLLAAREVKGPSSFRGDLAWIHAREGHAGMPYWPGGESGVTLDPGFDLGHASPDLFEKAYASVLTPAEMKACREVIGLKGDAAEAALASAGPDLHGIRISREQADVAFPFVAAPYWSGITKRYPQLLLDSCPASVQTALLSISFNRGPGNRQLAVMDAATTAQNWQGLAVVIGSMQQDHKLAGIRKRRRMESNIIRSELGMALLDTAV